MTFSLPGSTIDGARWYIWLAVGPAANAGSASSKNSIALRIISLYSPVRRKGYWFINILPTVKHIFTIEKHTFI